MDSSEQIRTKLKSTDINAPDADGKTSLLRAIEKGNREEFLRLLTEGADPNLCDDRGCSAVHRAATRPEVFWIEEVLKHGGDPNCRNVGNSFLPNTTPIQYALSLMRRDVAEYLIEHGADIDHVSDKGRSVVDYAIEFRNYQIVTRLLRKGADPFKGECRLTGGTYVSDAEERNVRHDGSPEKLAAYLEMKELVIERGLLEKAKLIREEEERAKKAAPARQVIRPRCLDEEPLYQRLTEKTVENRTIDELAEKADRLSGLLLASGVTPALKHSRYEDANFLQIVACFRAEYDFTCFRADATGPFSPPNTLGAMIVPFFTEVDSRLQSDADMMKAVARRIEGWEPKIPADFSPGYAYYERADEVAELPRILKLRDKKVQWLRSKIELLADDEYRTAMTVVKNYHTASKAETPTVDAYHDARETIHRIETEKGFKVPRQRSGSTLAK